MKEPTYLELSSLAESEVILLDDRGEPVVVIFVGSSYLSVDVRRQVTARVFHRDARDGTLGITTTTELSVPEVNEPTFNYAVEDWRAAAK